MPVSRNVLDMTTNKIVNLANPTAAQDGATKAYVDALVPGGGTAFVQGGNSFATNAALGTNDSGELWLEANNTTYVKVIPAVLGSAHVDVLSDFNATGNVAFSSNLAGREATWTVETALTNIVENMLTLTHNTTGAPA